MKNLKVVATDAEMVAKDYTVVYYSEESKTISLKGGTPTPPQPTFEYVDLGLPSGLKWAKCNVGATKETDYGKYFQWGDTVGYTDASHSTWSTAPFNNGSSSYDSSYFASVKDDVCPNGVLASQYDAASVNMGSNWRMPTQADFKELTANTTVTWETNFNDSGVAGRKFTSKKDSTKYIFIPSAGFAYNGSLDFQGSYGGVWSSSLYSSIPNNAWLLGFDSGSMGIDYNGRYSGYSVRGVLE